MSETQGGYMVCPRCWGFKQIEVPYTQYEDGTPVMRRCDECWGQGVVEDPEQQDTDLDPLP